MKQRATYLDTLEVLVTDEHELRQLCTLRTNVERVELFYHYPWGSRSPALYHDGSMDEAREGYLPDHISFHCDGRVHSKARDATSKNKYFNTTIAEINPFNLDRGKFLPVLVESFNLDRTQLWDARCPPATGGQFPEGAVVYDVSGLRSFSLLLVSSCARVNPQSLLGDHGLERLSYVGQPCCLEEVFTADEKRKAAGHSSAFATRLIVACVRETLPLEEMAANESVACESSTTVVLPPIEMLGRMIDTNTDARPRGEPG